MARKSKSPVATHRARKERHGFVRVEVSVRREAATLVRRAAAALSDPSLSAEARRILRQPFKDRPRASLKALLASAPLEGIDLDRSKDSGRDVEL